MAAATPLMSFMLTTYYKDSADPIYLASPPPSLRPCRSWACFPSYWPPHPPLHLLFINSQSSGVRLEKEDRPLCCWATWSNPRSRHRFSSSCSEMGLLGKWWWFRECITVKLNNGAMLCSTNTFFSAVGLENDGFWNWTIWPSKGKACSPSFLWPLKSFKK